MRLDPRGHRLIHWCHPREPGGVKRFIRSASLTNYAEIAAGAGLDPRRMLEEFGLPAQSLVEPELKVPIDAVRDLLEASAERSGVEAFGLLMAEKRRLAHLGPLGLLMREQPTMHHALQALARSAKSSANLLCHARAVSVTARCAAIRSSTALRL